MALFFATPAAMPVYVARWFGATDVMVMQLIMEIPGMNDLVKNALSQVAGAIAGMVEESCDHRSLKRSYPSIAVTELGFSDQCAKHVVALLIEKGYHVYPFHANGVRDLPMDRLIAQGFGSGAIKMRSNAIRGNPDSHASGGIGSRLVRVCRGAGSGKGCCTADHER